MAKKAFLVKASVMTRIVIDVPEDFDIVDFEWGELSDKMVASAIPRLRENLCGDSIEEVDEDLECPYDEKFDK